MRRRIKHGDLLNELSNKNYTAKLLTVEIGVMRPTSNVPGFIKLQECIGLTRKQIKKADITISTSLIILINFNH